MRTAPHSSSRPTVAGFTPNSHSAIQAIGSSSTPHPIALTRHRHDRDPPARSRDLSHAITAQTTLKIATTNPIAASGPGQPRLMAAADSSFVARTCEVGPPPLSVVAGGGAAARLQDEDAPAEQQQDDREEVEAEQPQRGPGHGQQGQPPSQRPEEAPPRTAAPAA